MANKKQKQAQKRRQAQKRQVHDVAKSRDRDHEREYLPKTGTKADNAYLLRRSREDVVDFGLMKGKGGWITVAIAILVVMALIGLMFILVFND